jgi:23S rRNA U2552 (ribose-2'-O)-methylase RlmE/FtsJ
VSRVVPVQARAGAAPQRSCFAEIAEAAAAIGRIRPGESFIVRCTRRGRHEWRSRELEREVARLLERATGGVGEYQAETHWHVSVQVYQDLALVGVDRPGSLLQKRATKQRKYRPGERPLNRAQMKLREALAAFDIELPPGARALDLGAAPGGWTEVLAERAAEVVAVDPGDLDPRVAGRGNVRHLRCRAEELVARGELPGGFDLVTCDMNLDPAEAARIMCLLAPLLRPGAPALMTVKYVTRERARHEREAREILGGEFRDIRFKHLPHNARETTAAMRRADGGAVGSGGA